MCAPPSSLRQTKRRPLPSLVRSNVRSSVLEQFDFDVMFDWLQRTVKACEAETWPASVENLERFFERA
jgi:hypothetical protein